MKKKLLALVVVSLFIQLGAIGAGAIAAEDRQIIDIAGHPVKGPADAPVTVIVFSDYLCPSCAGLEPVLHRVLERHPNDVRLVHKLCPHHDLSREAVAAAYAAWDQGKFWEYHGELFDNQLVLNKAKILAIAKGMFLDLNRFKEKMKDPAIQKLIDRDMDDVSRLGIVGTPTVYVNGKFLKDRSLQGFEAAIDRELAR